MPLADNERLIASYGVEGSGEYRCGVAVVSAKLLQDRDTTGLPDRRRVLRMAGRGDNNRCYSRWRVTLPVSGQQTLGLSTTYTPIPADAPTFFVEDANDNNNGNIIGADGNQIVTEFAPMFGDGSVPGE